MNAAAAAVRWAGDGVISMRDFPPSDAPPAEESERQLDRADLYVGLIGVRYGSPVADRPGVSYTELEFQIATERGMPRYVFLIDVGAAGLAEALTDEDRKLSSRQAAFRKRLLAASGVTVKTVASPAEVEVELSRVLLELRVRPRRGPAQDARSSAQARRGLLGQVRQLCDETDHDRALPRIEPRLAERPGAIGRRPRAILHRSERLDRALPPGLPAGAIFRELGGQLLILGEAGTGKTNLLVELARDLLDRAIVDTAAPMPAVMDVSSWSDRRRPLAEWLVDELKRRYGVPRRLGRLWVEDEQIVPLLDGLDEVDPEHQEECLAAINEFRRHHGLAPFALCSRIPDYDRLKERVGLGRAIVVLPLDRDQIERALREAGPSMAGLWSAVADAPELSELFSTPLNLALALATHSAGRNPSIQGGRTTQRTLVADYVSAMLGRGVIASAYSPRAVVDGLGWLASAMRAHGQSLFYPDWMQPSWLPGRWRRRLVTLGVDAAVSLLVSLVVLTIVWASLAQNPSALSAPLGAPYLALTVLLLAVVFAVVVHRPVIEPADRVSWSWPALGQGLRLMARSTLPAITVFGIAFGLIGAAATIAGQLGQLTAASPGSPGLQWEEWVAGAARAMGAVVGLGAGVGLVVGIASGVETHLSITPPTPGVGMASSRRSGLGSAFTVGLASALAFQAAPRLYPGYVPDAYVGMVGAGYGLPIPPVLVDAFADLVPTAVICLVIGIAVGLVVRLVVRSETSDRGRLGLGLVVGLGVAIVVGLVHSSVSAAMLPLGYLVRFSVQGIADWLIAGILAGLIAALGGGVTRGVLAGAVIAVWGGIVVEAQGQAYSVGLVVQQTTPAGLAAALVIAAAVGLQHGGGAYLRHLVLRVLLVRSGSMPPDYVAFLDHAARLTLLQRRGGGYQFVHGLLAEYFADLYEGSESANPWPAA